MRNLVVTVLVSAALSMFEGNAHGGRGGSTTLIKSAVASGSDDAIVAEVERAEQLACLSCIEPIRQLVDYPSQRVRDVAGWWLGKRGVRAEVIADMTARLSTAAQDPIAARNAADVLGAMRDFTTLPQLAGYLAHPLDEASGAAAARAVGNIGHPTGLAALSTGFASSLAGVRAASLEALRMLRAPASAKVISNAQAIVPLFADQDATVRRQAALTAGFLKDKAATAGLSQLVTGDGNALVRKAAAWALGQIGDGAGAPALEQATNDSDAFVRSVASAALANLK